MIKSLLSTLFSSTTYWEQENTRIEINLPWVILNSQLIGDFFDLIQLILINSVNYSVWTELAGIFCMLQYPWWFAFSHAKQVKNVKADDLNLVFAD